MAVPLTLPTITSFGIIFIFVLLGVSGSIDSTSKSPGSGNVGDFVTTQNVTFFHHQITRFIFVRI